MEYNTVSMIAIIAASERSVPFLLDTFFPNEVTSEDSAEIAFDVMLNTRRVAPFVAPHVPGRIVESEGFRQARFAPPHIRDVRSINPNRALVRVPGEAIGGTLSANERAAANLAMDMADQIDMIDRRLELMASDALQDGIVTVAGEGYDGPVAINFGRDAQLTQILTGAARWGEAGVSPIDGLLDMSNLVLRLGGYGVTDIVIGNGAYRYLRKDPEFKEAVNTQLAGTDASMIRAQTVVEGAVLIGKLNNQISIWLYSQRFIDPADSIEKDVFPDMGVLLGSRVEKARGYLGLGAVQNESLSYTAGRHIPDTWVETNPRRRMIQMATAPLTVLARPNSTAFILVR
jgi:hypothetical protein